MCNMYWIVLRHTWRSTLLVKSSLIVEQISLCSLKRPWSKLYNLKFISWTASTYLLTLHEDMVPAHVCYDDDNRPIFQSRTSLFLPNTPSQWGKRLKVELSHALLEVLHTLFFFNLIMKVRLLHIVKSLIVITPLKISSED